MINSIDEIIRTAKTGERAVIAVAGAHDSIVIEAVVSARRAGIAEPILVGNIDEMTAMLEGLGEAPASYEMLSGGDYADCAKKAVVLCAQRKAQFLMKGIVSTADIMRAVFNRDNGLRNGKLTAHYMFYEAPAYPRMFVMTDGGINMFPDVEKKAEILENAARALQALGYPTINAACLCAAETINPKAPSTLDADALCKMTDRWAPYHMNVFGPAALDLAISKDACLHKHYDVEGAGEADIILVPNYEVGNAMGKACSLFGGAKSAGVVLGAKVPIVLVSRSDTAQCKMASIALGSVLSTRMKFE